MDGPQHLPLLDAVQRELLRQAGSAASALEHIHRAMLEGNPKALRYQAYENIHRDAALLHERLLEMLAVYRPLAGELRAVYASAMIVGLLANIAKLNHRIARAALDVRIRLAPKKYIPDITQLFTMVIQLLRSAASMYIGEQDAHVEIASKLPVIRELNDSLFERVHTSVEDPVHPGTLRLLSIAGYLEQQAENVHEITRWSSFEQDGRWIE